MQIGQFQQNKFELSNSRMLAKGYHSSEKMSSEGKSTKHSKGKDRSLVLGSSQRPETAGEVWSCVVLRQDKFTCRY